MYQFSHCTVCTGKCAASVDALWYTCVSSCGLHDAVCLTHSFVFTQGHCVNQGDEVGGSNDRCLLTSSFDAKKSLSETELAFNCHILAPVKQSLN